MAMKLTNKHDSMQAHCKADSAAQLSINKLQQNRETSTAVQSKALAVFNPKTILHRRGTTTQDMSSPTVLPAEGWWKCCQCSREVNPDWYGDSCPDCHHSKCEHCEEVGGGIRPRPKNGLNGMLATHTFCGIADCLLGGIEDCECECGSCTCKPPRNPPPRPTQSINGMPY